MQMKNFPAIPAVSNNKNNNDVSRWTSKTNAKIVPSSLLNFVEFCSVRISCWPWLKQMWCVAESSVLTTTSISNSCIPRDEVVTLTHKIVYRGTSLIPMVSVWSWTHSPDARRPWVFLPVQRDTTKSSFGHLTTYTFKATGKITDTYSSVIFFKDASGPLLPGVQIYHNNMPSASLRSSPFGPVPVSSESCLHEIHFFCIFITNMVQKSLKTNNKYIKSL